MSCAPAVWPGALAALALLCGGAIAQFPAVRPEVGTPAGDEIRIDGCALGPGLAGSVHPQIVGTASGPGGLDLHVVWHDDRDATTSVYYRRVASHGAGPQPCEVRLSGIASDPQHHALLPRLATDGVAELYVLYVAFAGEDGSGALDRTERVMFVRSLDAGASWSSPAQLAAGHHVGVPSLCTDRQGRLYAVWNAEAARGEVAGVYLVASDDSGASWTAPRRVNDGSDSYAQEAVVACDSHGGVAVAYIDHVDLKPPEGPDGGTPRMRYGNVYVQRSDDPAVLFGGAPFPPPEQLSFRAEAGRLAIAAWSAGAGAVPDKSLVLVGWKDFTPVDRKGLSVGPLGFESTLESGFSIDGGPFQREVPIVPGPIASPDTIGPSTGGPAPSPSSPGGPGGHGVAAVIGQPAGAAGGVIAPFNDGPGFYSLDLGLAPTGRVYAAYGRVDPPLHNSALFPETNSRRYVYVNVFDPYLARWGAERLVSTAGAPFTTQGRPLLPVPNVSVDEQGNVFVVWLQSSIVEHGAYMTYGEVNAAWSVDGGQSWEGPTGVANKPDGPGTSGSAAPRVYARGGVAAVVWDDRRAWTRFDVPGGLLPGDPLGAPDVYLNLITLPEATR